MKWLRHPVPSLLAALCVLLLNLVFVGDYWGQAPYMIVWILAILVLSGWLMAGAACTRYQTMTTVAFAVLIERCVFKSALLWQMARQDPTVSDANWLQGAIFANGMGFVVSLPLILILAFTGGELGVAIARRFGLIAGAGGRSDLTLR